MPGGGEKVAERRLGVPGGDLCGYQVGLCVYQGHLCAYQGHLCVYQGRLCVYQVGLCVQQGHLFVYQGDLCVQQGRTRVQQARTPVKYGRGTRLSRFLRLTRIPMLDLQEGTERTESEDIHARIFGGKKVPAWVRVSAARAVASVGSGDLIFGTRPEAANPRRGAS